MPKLSNSVNSGTSELENGLRLIQEAFSTSEVEYLARSADADALESALRSAPLRNEIKNNFAYFDATDASSVEDDRHVLSETLGQGHSIDALVSAGRLTVNWDDFQSHYDQHYAARHEEASLHELRDRANEILASHEWWIFENLAEVDQFPTRFKRISKEVLRELRRCNCTAAVMTASLRPAYCPICGYSLKSDRYRSLLCGRLWENVNQAIVAYDHVLQRIKDDVIERAEHFSGSVKDEAAALAATELLERLNTEASVANYTENELRAVILVFKYLNRRPPEFPIWRKALLQWLPAKRSSKMS